MTQRFSASPATLALGLATASLAEELLSPGLRGDARTRLVWGLAGALGMALLAALLAGPLARCRQGRGRQLCCLGLGVWLSGELVQLLWQAQQLCWQQFSSLAVIGLAPGLIWLGWQSGQPSLDHAARALWWLAAFGALVVLLGLGGQARWQRLVEADPITAPLGLPLYAEYFALPLLAPNPRRAAALPFVSFGVEAGFALAVQLVFGSQGESYGGAELLRALSLGVFSRLDALLVLIWLVCGLFRICLLSYLIHGFYAALKKEARLC